MNTKNRKFSANYWADRLFFHHQSKDRRETTYSCSIQFKGRRERFSLGTASREVGGRMAAEIYRSLQSDGWDGTLAIYKKGYVIFGSLTIGQYVEAVRKVWIGSPNTINLYIRALRKIVSEIENLDPQGRRFDHMKSGADDWHREIDQVPLTAITDEKVNKWKFAFLGQAEPSVAAQNKRKISINSYLRNAKSLFADNLVKATKLEVPLPMPLKAVDFFGGTDQRYFSTFDIRKLLIKAQDKLSKMDPDGYAVVLLSAFAGLRRKEIDLLEWPSIDFKNGLIQLRMTQFFDPKNIDALRPIPIREKWVLDWFKTRRAELGNREGFVIAPDLPYEKDQVRDYYRTKQVLERISRWLRSHGVKDGRPLHTLRKEAGSDIVRRAGLVAGAAFLRHKTTAVTMMHYSDYRATETPSFGDIATPENVVQFASP